MTSWYLVTTVPHRERTVARILRAFSIPHHLFVECRQHVWRGRLIERLHPVFPGYVFVACWNLWDLVRSIGGVLGFVRFNNELVVVKNHVIDSLVAASVDDVLPTPQVPIVSRFCDGDRIRIQGTGMFAGRTGRFVRMLAVGQALIEVDLFGRWVSVPADDRDLEIDIPRRRRRRRRRRREGGYRQIGSVAGVAAAA